jgi:hypothetical protein
MAFKKSYYLLSILKKRQQRLLCQSRALPTSLKLCNIYSTVYCRKPTEAQGCGEMALPGVLLNSMKEWSGEGVLRTVKEAWNGCSLLAIPERP